MKKFVSLIILAALVLTSFTAIASDIYTIDKSGDSVRILTDLGIFESSDFSADAEYVTRGDAARLFVKMTGAGVSASNPMPFADVDKADENYDYIASAYALKYISGTSQTEFSPAEYITAPQAAKIIMSILGYDTLCIAAGGYPAGYLKYANDADLFRGVALSQGGHITSSQMSSIILNALQAELMIQTVFGDESAYNSYEDRNLLSENFDIYTQTAVIEADRFTSLYDKSGTGDDEVIADSVVYDSSEYTSGVPVGCRCEIYYRMTSRSSKRELLSVVADEEENSIYTLSADDVISASPSQIEYTGENGRIKKLSISSGAVFLKNGQLASDVNGIFSDFDEATLIDNDKNGVCDVALVNKYTVMLVKNISKDDFTVYDKISAKSYSFDDTTDFTTAFYYGGKSTDFYEIEKDSVLSVLIPEDTSVFHVKHVYITDEISEGKVDEINTSQSEIVSGGMAYKITADALENIRIANSYRFRFDKPGRIVSAESIENIKNYAYLTAFKTAGFGEVSAQLFTTGGEWIEATLDSDIKLNGAKIPGSDVIGNQELFSDGELECQMIEYTLSSDGLIRSITTAEDVTSIRFTEEENEYIDRDEFRLSFSSASARLFNSSGTITFGEMAHIGTDAVVMIIPETGLSKDEFLVTTPDKLTHNVLYTGIKFYNCDEYAESPLIVVYDTVESYKGINPMIVSKVTTVLDENGDTVQRVYGYARTTYEAEYDVAGFTSLEAMAGDSTPLKAGDFIIPVVNADGKIVNYQRMHSAGVDSHGASSANVFTDYVTTYGSVISASPDYVVLDFSSGKASFRLYSTSVYVCEPSRDGGYDVRLGSVNDFQFGDDVVIRTYYTRGIVAVIYKK